jgi:transposase
VSNGVEKFPLKSKELDELIKLYPTLSEAYRLKVLFNDLWEMPDRPAADVFLRQWCDQVDAAKIPAFMKFAIPFGHMGRVL